MEALGLIEVVGLTAGVEAADVACKSANVELVGYELAKGGGFVTIKVLGQVGAVTAAVDAAALAAERLTRVVSKLVIPRPSGAIEPMVRSAATVGLSVAEAPPTPEPAPEPEPEPEPDAPSESHEAPSEDPAPTRPAGTSSPRKDAAAPAKAIPSPAKTNVGRK